MSEEIRIHLTLTAAPSAPRVPLTIVKDTTPSQLCAKAAEATRIPPASLKLIFRGRLIPPNNTTGRAVELFNLEEECVVHCMGKPVAEETPAVAALPTPSSATASVLTAPPASVSASASVAASSGSTSLESVLSQLRASHDSATYQTAVTTLEKLLTNITSHPMEEKYRKVKRTNAAFSRRLGGLNGGEACMKAVGFVVEDDSYVLHASAEAWPQLVATQERVKAAVRDANTTSRQPGAPPQSIPTPAIPNLGGGGGMPTMGAGGMPNMPGMDQAMRNLMANPALMRSMLQNPQVQRMMETDPRFANNPMMRQSMEMFVNNPELMSQVTSMMNDPNMRSQMQGMMNDPNMRSQMQAMMNGGANSFGANNMGVVGAPSTNNTASNAAGSGTSGTNNSNSNSSGTGTGTGQTRNTGRSDSEMTEEEMLQEAIARSLRES